MQNIRLIIERNIWVRIAILVVIAAAIGWALLPAEIRSSLSLKATYHLGTLLGLVGPAILVAGAVGFVTMKRKMFFWTFSIVLAAAVALYLKDPI